MGQLERLNAQIQADPMNHAFTEAGIAPLYAVYPRAKILIIGQAPGKAAQDSRLFWNDKSGDRLRQWLGVSREFFYHSEQVAILPMDFYYPGKGASGDLPPRAGFAAKWHSALLQAMPDIALTLLVGSYAVHAYLGVAKSAKLTDLVQHYEQYLPTYWPLIHPSPRNQIWMKQHPWFEADVVPALQARVASVLGQTNPPVTQGR